MKTYLITGGAGFIGSNYVKYILNKKENAHLICLDKLTYSGNLENIKTELKNHSNRLEFIKGDINNTELVECIFSNWDIDYVVNFAAETHVDRSIEEADQFLETNILGVQNLLKIAKKHWKTNNGYKENKRFLQISTDEVYGSAKEGEYFTEETSLKPNSPYAASKTSADHIIRSYHKTHDFPVVITRCSNNYGPYQFPEKLIPLMINNIIEGEKLPVYGDGSNVRDWIHVKDHCKAIQTALKQGKTGEIYNIGGET